MVPGELDGARLDKAVATLLGVSRNEARRLCDSGVLLEGRPSAAKSTVSEGDRIVAPVPIGAPSLAPEPVEFGVLLETADYLPEHYAEPLLNWWRSHDGRPVPLTDTVRELTGHSPRPFTAWATDHLADFR